MSLDVTSRCNHVVLVYFECSPLNGDHLPHCDIEVFSGSGQYFSIQEL